MTLLLRLLVALLVAVIGPVSGGGVVEAQNGVAAINPGPGPDVAAAGDIGPARVGSETRLFDDGVLGCCVAPSAAGRIPWTSYADFPKVTMAMSRVIAGDLASWAAAVLGDYEMRTGYPMGF